MKSVFIASEPNFQKDDRAVARRLLFRVGQWKEGESIEKVCSKLKSILTSKYCFTFDTGRASLYSIFQAIGIKPKDEIIIQSFTCLAVPLPVKWIGAKAICVDIDPSTYNATPENIRLAITSKTRAVVIQHTFGIPAEVDKIKQIIDNENAKRNIQNKIYLIEDLAHSLGVNYQGKKLGTFGDASILSFGQDKVISCTQGGAVITNDELIRINIEKQYNKIKHLSSFRIFRNIIHPLLWNIINQTYYFPPVISIGKILITFFRLLGLLKNQANIKDITKPQVFKLSNAQSEILQNQLNKLNRFTEHRKNLTRIYSKHFKNIKEGLVLVRYPITLERPNEVVTKLKSNKIIPGNWYNNPIYPKGIDMELLDYNIGSCPTAEKISSQIVNLPTNINTSETQAEIIVQILT